MECFCIDVLMFCCITVLLSYRSIVFQNFYFFISIQVLMYSWMVDSMYFCIALSYYEVVVIVDDVHGDKHRE